MDITSTEELSINRDQPLPLGSAVSGTSFPGTGDSVVGLAKPYWDIGHVIGKVETVFAGIDPELLQSGHNGSQLEDHNNELERVDVDVARGRWLELKSSSSFDDSG